MEDFCAAGDDEGDGLDASVVDCFESTHDFVFVGVDATFGEKGDTALGLGGLVLGEEFELVVLVLEVAYIAVAGVCQQRSNDGWMYRHTLCLRGRDIVSRHPRKACKHLK